jgi:hypothetical protein
MLRSSPSYISTKIKQNRELDKNPLLGQTSMPDVSAGRRRMEVDNLDEVDPSN